jgi:hypothetical protein
MNERELDLFRSARYAIVGKLIIIVIDLDKDE